METTIPTMLTVKETARRSGLAEYYIRKLIAERKIVFVKAGKKYLVNFERLADFLNEGEAPEEEAEEKNYIGITPIPQKLSELIRRAR